MLVPWRSGKEKGLHRFKHFLAFRFARLQHTIVNDRRANQARFVHSFNLLTLVDFDIGDEKRLISRPAERQPL